MKRIAFYGGSFDPPHNGHLTIARKLIRLFKLDEVIFVPAFHAPHKKDKNPTSAFHRYAMLCLATNGLQQIKVSTMELDVPTKPYTVETLSKLKDELTDAQIFFVMGADSWAEITTWRDWEKVLTIVNIIVVTRPTHPIGFSHVTREIRERIVDLRERVSSSKFQVQSQQSEIWNLKFGIKQEQIYITDVVNLDISATEIRRKIRQNESDWHGLVPNEVAKYIEKYDIY
ncbi:MAG: nicotinate-nucleotide adenylyltransferase [Acidobacteriota bacterium]|nr:nicotinate-nucleotide adenylyltransferase [Acidobacteriota bacterium]